MHLSNQYIPKQPKSTALFKNKFQYQFTITTPPQYHANQQLQKKRRPATQGVELDYPKKRRALVSSGDSSQTFNTPPVQTSQTDFNDIFRKGWFI